MSGDSPKQQSADASIARGASEASDAGIRRRNVSNMKNEAYEKSNLNDANTMKEKLKIDILSSSYWLTRIVMLRYLAFIYCVAFLVALYQNTALIGHDGLLPADVYLDSVAQRAGNSLSSRILHAPTVLWFFDYSNGHIDDLLYWTAGVGLILSLIVMTRGAANIVLMLVIWALYHSIVNVGQRWYSFGWESQLLETGFLAAFLCPVLSLARFPVDTPTSVIVLLAYRWLIFRIMIGAGLIKLRGDQCWRDLTCMNYHYETQPVPNPISYYMHQEPVVFHKFETLTNHFVELIAPVLVLLTRRLRIYGGLIQILFQVILIISGNLSFLNWLTIVPSLACFDDSSLAWLFTSKTRSYVASIEQRACADKKSSNPARKPLGCYVRRVFNISLGCLIAYLSIPIVQNLLSSRQIMNTSFDPLRLVNTYGAFGSITKERTEVIFQGTASSDPTSSSAKWLEYEFKCKPGDVTRRPCLISPYHYRLDWLMWFAAFQSYQHNPWLVHLSAKFLVNDPNTMSLIAHNPFDAGQPPKWVRAEHYRYVFTSILKSNSTSWWKRKRIDNYLPPVSLTSLSEFMRNMGWKIPQLPKK